MGSLILPLLLACVPADDSSHALRGGSYLCQPAFAVDDLVRVPTEPYSPRAGDVFLATDQALWSRVGHWMAGTAGVQHSGIFFLRSNGKPGLLEAGPFNSLKVEILDPYTHMHNHVAAGDRCGFAAGVCRSRPRNRPS